MRLVFIHGWSVTSTDTYGGLPEVIQQAAARFGIEIEIRHVFLGRYISFHDEVQMDDLAQALDYALRHDIPENDERKIEPFSCITHSTGGPLVRRWLDMFYGAARLEVCPLRHLVMLAPANHGSALALIGKSRIGRIKSWFGGVEPGQGVLDWLCLGSDGAWQLKSAFINYQFYGTSFYPFVLSGQTIDETFYDFLNAYLAEVGSDGVVRLAGANLNYSYFTLVEEPGAPVYPADAWERGDYATVQLSLDGERSGRPQPVPFGVIAEASHSGDAIGIMKSVTPETAAGKPVVQEIMRCLQVTSEDQYRVRDAELADLTQRTQQGATKREKPMPRCVMFIFRVSDQTGATLSDYDLFLLGSEYRKDKLPEGFFIDKQKNPKSGALVYYMNYDKLADAKELGIQVIARPTMILPLPADAGDSVFAGYRPAEFRIEPAAIQKYVNANETVYVDIILRRYVDREAARLGALSDGVNDFKRAVPGGTILFNGRGV